MVRTFGVIAFFNGNTRHTCAAPTPSTLDGCSWWGMCVRVRRFRVAGVSWKTLQQNRNCAAQNLFTSERERKKTPPHGYHGLSRLPSPATFSQPTSHPDPCSGLSIRGCVALK